jgi:hypothetical protein
VRLRILLKFYLVTVSIMMRVVFVCSVLGLTTFIKKVKLAES